MKKKNTNPIAATGGGILFVLVLVLVVLAGGAVIVSVGMNFVGDALEFRKTAVEHTGTISRIDAEETGTRKEPETSYTVYVKYEVDGTEYERKLNYYLIGMEVGNRIKIYYDPKNPGEMHGSVSIVPHVLAVAGALLAFLVGVGMFFWTMRDGMVKRRLIKAGYVVDAEFEEVVTDTSNDAHPFLIYCRWTDADTGVTYLIKSEKVWGDPTETIAKKGIKTFPVYVNPKNPKQYYVSVEELGGAGVGKGG